MRRAVRWVMVVATGLALVAGSALPASAAAPVVVFASSVSDDLGRLQLGLQHDASVRALTARVVDPATGSELATLNDFTFVDGDTTSSRWVSSSRAKIDRFGFFQVDVDITDADGVTTSQVAVPGGFSYFEQAVFTSFAADRTAVDTDHRTVTVTGRLQARHPGTFALRPLGGTTVAFEAPDPFTVAPDAVTAADGTFSAPFTITQAGTITAFWNFHADAPTVVAATPAAVSVSITPSPTRVSLVATPGVVDVGEQVTLSGRAEVFLGGRWQPLVDRQAAVFYGTPDQLLNLFGSVQTDATGAFSVTDAPFQGGSFAVIVPSDDLYVAEGRGTSTVVVYQPREFSDFGATRSPRGVVVASGHVQFPGNVTPGVIPVDIQWRAPGTSRWKTVARVAGAQWDGTGYAFSADLRGLASGRLRAFYPGLTNLFRPLTSSEVPVPAARA